MVQDNDILQLTVFGRQQGQDVLNVFHYLYFTESVNNPSLEDIATAWGIEFDTKVLVALSTKLSYQRVLLENLTDGLEFSDGTYIASGDVTGEALPSHDTYSVKLIRSTKLTRNGRKSFAGVAENLQADGAVLLSAPQIQDIEDFCGLPLSLPVASISPDPVILSPVIIGRTLDVNGVYQLDLTKINPVTGAQLKLGVRTQNTRKP